MPGAIRSHAAVGRRCIDSVRVGSALKIVGTSAPMRELGSLIRTVSCHDCTILIQGESGTGKELVARQVHLHSQRKAGPFVAVDCTALQDTLFESQLFEHIRGASTGAIHSSARFFRTANGGTLSLARKPGHALEPRRRGRRLTANWIVATRPVRSDKKPYSKQHDWQGNRTTKSKTDGASATRSQPATWNAGSVWPVTHKNVSSSRTRFSERRTTMKQ